MIDFLHPVVFFLISSLLLLILPSKITRSTVLLLFPLFLLFYLFGLEEGEYWLVKFADNELLLGKVDRLSLGFAYAFAVITFLVNLYGLHIEDKSYHLGTQLYQASSFGVVFAGDWLTFFGFWELMAIGGLLIVLNGKKKRSLDAAFRYLILHLLGGTLLFAGLLMSTDYTQSIRVSESFELSLASFLILVGFLLNAACPPLHGWLPDAYPEAKPEGTVVLSAFTTKVAVYALARVFPGLELLVWLGVIMALYGIFYAILENNLRRLLSYHVISQVGYMVCGIGLGTFTSINGAVAHAFSNILHKSLLLMAVGSVIYATGREEMWEFKNIRIFKTLRFSLWIYMVGAFSISGVPFFAGFSTKTVLMFASAELHRPVVNTLLHLASLGTFLSIALKLPYGTWLGKERGFVTVKIPKNMSISMVLLSFLCVMVGVYPPLLYATLPYPMGFDPYNPYNVITTLQLFAFSFFAFFMLKDRFSFDAKINLDVDWFYRKFGTLFFLISHNKYNLRLRIQSFIADLVNRVITLSQNPVQNYRILIKRVEYLPRNFDPPKKAYDISLGIGAFLGIYGLIALIFLLF
ncbi:MAG: Na(+)/H(+) antiporter subunit D [Desulfobacterota bacterium]|nr:Na(+)/H(+) antiporter subunit D [Thermodesulfobacteriota bacterium]MDW8002146.1 Na(+)/H(+) antiporter subunit D [Deltaproteobacteria bacterium]